MAQNNDVNEPTLEKEELTAEANNGAETVTVTETENDAVAEHESHYAKKYYVDESGNKMKLRKNEFMTEGGMIISTTKDFKHMFKDQWLLIAISVVYVAYGILFYYVPLFGWLMGFQNYKIKDGIFHSQFVGLEKFKYLFGDKLFLQTVWNTFGMGILNLVTSFVAAIAFAILLNEVKTMLFKKPIQTISYMPHFLSWIIVTGILHDALSVNGIVNELLLKLPFINDPISFFSIPKLFWPLVAFANVWKETGWNAIIYLAAITAIDPCLYEAASIDGAGRFGKIWYITLPSIRPTIVILLLLNIGNVLNAGFEVQYLLGNGLVQRVAQTIDIYVLKYGIGMSDYSVGTAAGIFKSAVAILLIVIFNFIASKTGEERLY